MADLTAAQARNTGAHRIASVLWDVTARPSGAVGLALVVFHVVLAIVSPWIVPYDVKSMDASLMLQGPSGDHWLGADHLGRDVFSRVIMGGVRHFWSPVWQRHLRWPGADLSAFSSDWPEAA